MKMDWRAPVTGCSLAVVLSLGGCQGSDFDENGEAMNAQFMQKGQKFLTHTEPTPESETVQSYAARCDAATGIHVPEFSCLNDAVYRPEDEASINEFFSFLDQRSSWDNFEGLDHLSGAEGDRFDPDNPSDPLPVGSHRQRIVAGGTGFADSGDSAYYLNTQTIRGAGARTNYGEVTITSLAGAGEAGLMIRPSLEDAAAFFFVGLDETGRVTITSRNEDNGEIDSEILAGSYSLPLRVRVRWDDTKILVDVLEGTVEDHPSNWRNVVPPTGPGQPPHLFDAPVDLTPDGFLGQSMGLAAYDIALEIEHFMSSEKCDKPNALHGSCSPGGSFQVLERTADAIVVANCRKSGLLDNTTFNDIAVIQYNRVNGAMCFYQSPTDQAHDGALIPAPSGKRTEGDPDFPWEKPIDFWTSTGCTGCHENGPLIRSPYLSQTGFFPGIRQGFDAESGHALRYVGEAFEQDLSWLVTLVDETFVDEDDDTTTPLTCQPVADMYGASCTGCHGLAVSNVDTFQLFDGTARDFSVIATSRNQTPNIGSSGHKNPVSEASPTWMPYPPLTDYSYREEDREHPEPRADVMADVPYNPYLYTAERYRECANRIDFANPNGICGCEYTLFARSYDEPFAALNEARIGISAGDSEGNLDHLSLTAPPGTDIYQGSDSALMVYGLVPGDATLMVRVDSLEGPHEYAKAGLAIRDWTSPDVPVFQISQTYAHGFQLQYRLHTGENTVQVDGQGELANTPQRPAWLRIDRSGTTFIALVSLDEKATWLPLGGAVTFDTFNGSFGGVVSTAHSESTTESTAEFSGLGYTRTQGWEDSYDPHVLVDHHFGDSKGFRKEWITEETMQSQGGDIYGGADDFLYSFKTFGGEGELTTIVKEFSADSRWGKAGLMIRDSGAEGSPNVFFGRIRDGLTFQRRAYPGGPTQSYNCEGVIDAHAPVALRLEREETTSGFAYRAQYRQAGEPDWHPMRNCEGNNAILTFNLGAIRAWALHGLAVSSQQANDVTRAVFHPGTSSIAPPGFQKDGLGEGSDPWFPPEPEPDPVPGGAPCASYCPDPTTITLDNPNNEGNGNHQGGNLGSGEHCYEFIGSINGGVCGLSGGRVIKLNGVTMPCNTGWPIPSKEGEGYCLEVTSGGSNGDWFNFWGSEEVP